MICRGRIPWPCYKCLLFSVQVLFHMEPYPHVVVTLLFWGVNTCSCIHWIQFQHTLAEHLALLRVVVHTESCLIVCTMGALLNGACYHGDCVYNQQDFLGLDAIVCPQFRFFTWSVTQKNLISMDRERCLLIVSFAITVAVVFSQCMGVAGCGWPISCKVIRIILPSLQLRNKAPKPASAADADATTNLRITHMIYSAPLITIGLVGSDLLPRKNFPATQLLALVSEK